MRESFETARHNCGPGKGLNKNHDSYSKMDMIPFEEWIGLEYLMPSISFGLNQHII